jgi:glycosyltransferase involved in cell wall biosynthesis
MTYASIIIPTHNRDQLLARAVNSALGQTVGEIEVIVVDDGCTDQTAEVMEVFKRYDPRVIYLQIPSALGLSGGLQRNEAIKIARGEFICYLDDDDVMTPWSVEGRGSFLEGREDLDFCWGRTLFIRNNVNHPDLDNLVTTRLVEKAGRGKEVHWVEGTILPDEFMHRSGVVGERSGIWWSSGRLLVTWESQ